MTRRWIVGALLVGVVVGGTVGFFRGDSQRRDLENQLDRALSGIERNVRTAKINAHSIGVLQIALAQQRDRLDAQQAAINEANMRLAGLGQPSVVVRGPAGPAGPSAPSTATPSPVCTLAPGLCKKLGL